MPWLIDDLARDAARGYDPVQVFVEDRRRLGSSRPSRWVPITALAIDPADLVPWPPSIDLTPEPRFAGRRSAATTTSADCK